MRTFSTSFVALKNHLEGEVWAQLLELVINPTTTAYFTSHPETIAYNGQWYQPVPFVISAEEQSGQGELPTMTVGVSNYRGLAFSFARDNDLSLNDVTVRLINTSLTTSGQDAFVKLQLLNCVFSDDIAQFTLGFNFTYDVEGPRVVYNRRDYPFIPINAGKLVIF